MGLGLLIDAPIQGRGWLKRRPPSKDVLARLEDAFRATFDDPLLAAHARFVHADDALDVHVHPAAGPIEIRVEGARVVCAAKTNPAGPGYHAYLVELLERAGERAGLSWRWTSGGDEDDAAADDDELGDECGFHASRDFEALQREMLAWLRGVCGLLVREEVEDVRICLPADVSPLGPDVCTPLGPRAWDWVKAVAAAPEGLLEHGRAFFPWWGRARDAAFWDGYGRALAWIDAPWHACASDDDARIYDAALAAFDRARQLDPRIVLPEREIAELRRLRDPDADPTLSPEPDGLGYRRGPMTWMLTGAWRMRGPGFWYDSYDDGTICRWFGDRTIHVTTFSADGSAEQLLGGGRKRLAEAAPADVVTWEATGLRAIGVVAWDDTEGHWNLQGQVAADGALCIATFAYPEEADRAWAEEAFRSITR